MPEDKKETKSLWEHGVYLLFGDIDEESMRDAVEFVLEANMNKVHKRLKIVINSRGGELESGFALIDAICGSKIPVHTVGIGCLASMGLSIFIAGEKGERLITPNTAIMSHQWWGGQAGKEHELIAAIKGNDLTSDKIYKHYSKHTGMKVEKVKKLLFPANDVWLSPQEAREMGLCDIVKEL
jgi:ATP-dependent Clp protease protease subunit